MTINKDIASKSITYFEKIKSQFDAIQEVNECLTEDQLVFDRFGVNSSINVCRSLNSFLDSLPDEEFKILQQSFQIYKNSKTFSSHIKSLYSGGIEEREKIVRCYIQKALSTYNVIKVIINTSYLYQGIDPTEAREIKINFRNIAEQLVKKVIQLIPRKLLMNFEDKTKLIYNLQKISAQPKEIYQLHHPLGQINNYLEKLVVTMNANQSLVSYLMFKKQFFKHWLADELHYFDCKNLETKAHKIPEYSKIKISHYQKLDAIFKNLDFSSQFFK